MIRTLIEVTSKDEWEHPKRLEAALDQLGYAPKEDPENTRFRHDLLIALANKGIKPVELVEQFRAEINEALKPSDGARP